MISSLVIVHLHYDPASGHWTATFRLPGRHVVTVVKCESRAAVVIATRQAVGCVGAKAEWKAEGCP